MVALSLVLTKTFWLSYCMNSYCDSRLQRCQSREGANLEYLKNVVLSFLLSNDSSSKRHMLNAIAAVLRFSPPELERVSCTPRLPVQGNVKQWQLKLWQRFRSDLCQVLICVMKEITIVLGQALQILVMVWIDNVRPWLTSKFNWCLCDYVEFICCKFFAVV